MLLYYITDRRQLPGSDSESRHALLDKIAGAAAAGVDLIQLRERDLTVHELEALARQAVGAVREANAATKLLINSRIDVALAVGANGVHLRSDDPVASDARLAAHARSGFVIGVSCHTVAEVRLAWSHGADFAVFGPVFEKQGTRVTLVEGLRAACAVTPTFVLALGGVTIGNAMDCLRAGAAGVAGIRLFQEAGELTRVVHAMRSAVR